MLKKLVTLVLSILMLSLPASAALVDIADEAYGEEIALLYDLGLVNGKEADLFMPADNLTRAEMTTIILRLLGADGTIPASFTDVPEDHWASKIIGTAAQMKIVNGISETEFAPEEAVTYPQAVKMLVCALGYDVQATAMGGYPSGYLSKASQIGVLDGTKDNGAPISRAMMAKLVANALEVNILVRTGYGDAYTYEEKENATLLNTYLGIAVIKGKVTANSMLNLGGAAAHDGQFSIGTTTIEEGASNGSAYIGRTVTAYVKEENDIYTALSVVPKYETGYLEIDAADILPSSTLTSLSYEVKGKAQKGEIASDAVWVYNGAVKRDMTPADLIFDIGMVSVISEDGGAAKIVFVYSYKNMIVDTVRTDLYRVTFKNPSEGMGSLVLDETDKSVKFTLENTDGSPATLEGLKEWDVLSVAANGNTYRIICSTRTVSGKVTELSEESAVIDGESYDIAGNVFRNKEITKPAVGMEANFYLDFTGKIAAADTESYEEHSYGYLVGAIKDKGIDGKDRIKLFTEDGEMKVFSLSKNFKLNNAPTETVISDVNTPIYAGGEVIEQLVRFKANSADELLTLDTALDITADRNVISDEERLDRFTEEAYYPSEGLWGSPLRSIGFEFLLREKTRVFSVPETYSGNDTMYKVLDPLSFGHLYKFTELTLFDIDRDSVISAMVTKGSGGTLLENVGVIKKISTTLTEDGTAAQGITMMTESGEVMITVDKEIAVELGSNAMTGGDIDAATGKIKRSLGIGDLALGDILWYSRPDSTGKVENARVVLRSETRPEESLRRMYYYDSTTKPDNGDYGNFIFTYADVKDVSKYGAKVEYRTDLNTKEPDTITRRTIVYDKVSMCVLYDSERETFTEISTSDIYQGDTIFSYRVNLQERLIVVYR